jgi:hypothetical protein
MACRAQAVPRPCPGRVPVGAGLGDRGQLPEKMRTAQGVARGVVEGAAALLPQRLRRELREPVRRRL